MKFVNFDVLKKNHPLNKQLTYEAQAHTQNVYALLICRVEDEHVKSVKYTQTTHEKYEQQS